MTRAGSLQFPLVVPVSRRGFLLTGTAALAAMKALPATPACTLIGEQEEGPYYVEAAKLRPDVTEGKPGIPLRLRIALLNSKTCHPLENAAVDIWHCDAVGIYSGFTSMGSGGPGGPGRGPGRMGSGMRRGPRPDDFGPPPGGPPGGPPPGGPRQIDATRFLRGVQITGPQGIVDFQTVYPGWYQGRTIHIHLKVHLGGDAGQTYQGGRIAHTGQLFFPEDLTAKVANLAPYESNSAVHRTLQSEDRVYLDQHGSSAMVKLEPLSKGSIADGFLATATLALDPEVTPSPARGGGGRGPRPF